MVLLSLYELCGGNFGKEYRLEMQEIVIVVEEEREIS